MIECKACNTLIPSHTTRPGVRLCAQCSATKQRERSASRVHYHGSWNRLSKRARKAQPWCSNCGAMGVPLELDHIVGRTTEAGVRVLCRACHNAKGRE